MRITTTYLKQVIKEELEFVLREEDFLNEGIKDFVKSKFGKSDRKNYDYTGSIIKLYNKLKTAVLAKDGFYNPSLQKTGKELYKAYSIAKDIKRSGNFEDASDASSSDYIKYATRPKDYDKSSPEERKKAIEEIIRFTEFRLEDDIRSAVVPDERTFHHFLSHSSKGVTLKDAAERRDKVRSDYEKEEYNKKEAEKQRKAAEAEERSLASKRRRDEEDEEAYYKYMDDDRPKSKFHNRFFKSNSVSRGERLAKEKEAQRKKYQNPLDTSNQGSYRKY